MKKYRAYSVILFSLILSQMAAMSGPTDDGSMDVVCNGLDSVIIYDCSTDFPEIPPELFDASFLGDQLAFENINLGTYLGGVINNPCSPPTINVFETIEPFTVCSDSFKLVRRFQISDGVTTQFCNQTLISVTPPLGTLSEPPPFIVYSNEDVDNIYQDWLDNFAYSPVPICGTPNIVTVPTNPLLDPQPNCQDGRCKFKRVQWILDNACTGNGTFAANFVVLDTVGPTVECPDNQSFNIADNLIITKIQDHLLTRDAQDECGDVASFLDDFNADTVKDSCALVYPIIVKFTATDECGNTGTCETTLSIINSQGPSIVCPTTDLELECGEDVNGGRINQWANNETEAQDAQGVFLPVVPNMDLSSLAENAYCNESFTIIFTATDECGRTDECAKRIIIRDTNGPTLNCVDDITIQATQVDNTLPLDAWLDSFFPVDADLCGTPYTPTTEFDSELVAFSCDPIAPIPVVVRAVDDCGNPSSCRANIVIENDYAAQNNCPGDHIIICDGANTLPNLISWLNTATITDNLGNETIMDSDVDINNVNLFSCDGSTVVNFLGQDFCGNNFDCSAMIITMDDVDPVITNCPTDRTIENDPNVDLNDQIDAWIGLLDATDNCGQFSFDDSFEPSAIQNCDQNYSDLIVFTVTDACDNSSTCSATLTINSDLKPNIACLEDLIVECGSTNLQDTINFWLENTNAFDFAGTSLNDRLLNTYILGSLSNINCDTSVMVTFTVEDDCLFQDECSSFISIIDSTPPTIDCPTEELTINTTAPDNTQTIENWLALATANDNCRMASIEEEYNIDLDNLCASSARTEVRFTATDGCDLTTECISFININSALPQIECPSILEFNCDESDVESQIETALANLNSTDNNGSVLGYTSNIESLVLEFSCFYETSVDFITEEDACNNTSSCTTRIRLADNTAPVIDCPPGITLSGGDPNLRPRALELVQNINVIDCNFEMLTTDLDTSLLEFSCDSEVVHPVMVSVIDSCGFISPCNFSITITNETLLTLQCPVNDLIIECGVDNDQIIRDWLDTASASDNSGINIPVDDNFDPNNHNNLNECGSVVTVNFRMVDQCSNASQDCMKNIIVDDTMLPEIVCPSDTSFTQGTATFDNDIQTWLSQYDASDNCGSVIVTDNYVPINQLQNCEPSVDLPVIFTGTDPCNLIGNCTAILTIRSDKQPSINCPADIVIECNDSDNSNSLDALANAVTGFDSENNPLQVQSSFNSDELNNLSCGELLQVEFSVEDDCAIVETCTWTISVEDTTPPNLHCPDNINVNSAEENLNNTLLNWAETYSANDLCSNVSVSYDDLSSIDLCQGELMTVINFLATDDCGQTSDCAATIILNTDDPSINCPDDLMLECGDSNNDQSITDWINLFTASDNDGISITPTNNFGSLSSLNDCEASLTAINFTVQDNCGKTAECVRNIIVDDRLAPEITCPVNQDINITDASTMQTSVTTWLNSVLAEDQCNLASTKDNFDTDLNTVVCSVVDVTFIATDECDNSSDCVASLTFTSDPPSIICPEPETINCGEPQTLNEIIRFLSMYETISMGTDTVTTSLDVDNFDLNCISSFTETITFTVTDNCENTGSCETAINFIPAARYYIPNTFSPSKSGQEIFMVYGNEAIDLVLEMSIYNRWGNLVYFAENFPPNDESYGWNGTWGNNSRKQADTYVYKIVLRDKNGDIFNEAGSITVIP